MATNEATVKWIDLGAASAYAIYVENGGTMTEAEWVEYLSTVSEKSAQAHADAQSAKAFAEAAEQAKTDVTEEAEQAIADIRTEGQTQITAVTNKGTEQVGAVNTAGSTQVTAVQAQGTASKDAVTAEGERQVERVSNQGILEVQAVTAEGTTQIGLVTAGGTTQIGLVTTEGTTQVGLVNTAGTTQVGNVNTKGQEVLASIPADYTQLQADIAPNYSNASTYSVGDYVMYGGVLYRCTTAIDTAEEWTAGHWSATDVGNDVSDLKSAIAPEYDATATYIKDSFVRKDGKLYHNTEPITTPEAWTASHWREVYVGAELTDLSQRADVLEWLARSRGLTPAQLQQIAASGHADEYFDIGDVIFIPWTDKTPAEPVTYDYPFVVVAFRDCVDANGVTHKNALWIQALYATPQTIAFDAPEQVIADEATFQADTYYYTKDGADWQQEEVTVGDPIPTSETYWKHYRSGMAGRIRYGSNDYGESAYRQWLNSDEDKGDWWTAQHASDVAPAQAATVPGWLTGFTEDWLAIFQPVEVKQAKNTVCDGGETAVMYDKFFLPSISELYGSQSLAAIEGAYWPYWKEATGLPSPNNGSSSNTNDARKIPQVSAPEGSAVTVRLRSAYRSNSYSAWFVYSAGYLNSSGGAYTAYRALPTCVIFESANVGA